MKFRDKVSLARAVLRYQTHRRPTPVAVAWLITGRCTASCSYCRWKDQRESNELDLASAKDMIDQMWKAGVRLISFTGGEPLLREDIGEIIAHAKSLGAVCKLNSNGDLVAKRLDALRPLDLLQISLDGPPDVQDRLRGKGSAHRAAHAITLARRAGIPVQVVACLTRDNVDRLDEVLSYASSLAVRLHVQPLAPGPMAQEESEQTLPTREQMLRAFKHLLALRSTHHPLAQTLGTSRSELLYYHRLLEQGVRGCHCALVTATLLPDGKLIFCGNAISPAHHDARNLGFSVAFSRLTLPECHGCSCVGKLRISKVFQLDPAALFDMFFR